MFFATGGQHLNADDFFKAKALTLCKSELAKMDQTDWNTSKLIEKQRA